MQVDEQFQPMDGTQIGGGDGMPLVVQLLMLVIPLLAFAGVIALIVRAFWVPADFPWRPTRIRIRQRDTFTYEWVKGPVMVRVQGGIKQYRAMTNAEWSNSKWKKLKP